MLIIFTSCEIVCSKVCLDNIKITKITDGDTVKGIINGKEISIRLSGIDCYETSKRDRAYKQAYLNKITIEEVVEKGKESKTILTNLLQNQNNVTVKFTDVDNRYNRNVGILYINNINVNEYMIKNGVVCHLNIKINYFGCRFKCSFYT